MAFTSTLCGASSMAACLTRLFAAAFHQRVARLQALHLRVERLRIHVGHERACAGLQHLAYKVPKQVFFRDQLPKSPVGKILRSSLRELTC